MTKQINIVWRTEPSKHWPKAKDQVRTWPRAYLNTPDGEPVAEIRCQFQYAKQHRAAKNVGFDLEVWAKNPPDKDGDWVHVDTVRNIFDGQKAAENYLAFHVKQSGGDNG